MGGGEFSSPAKWYKKSRVRIDADSFDVEAIRYTVHSFYERKEYPTLDRLLQVLQNLFNGGRISLWKLLIKLGFRYKAVNDKRYVYKTGSDN